MMLARLKALLTRQGRRPPRRAPEFPISRNMTNRLLVETVISLIEASEGLEVMLTVDAIALAVWDREVALTLHNQQRITTVCHALGLRRIRRRLPYQTHPRFVWVWRKSDRLPEWVPRFLERAKT